MDPRTPQSSLVSQAFSVALQLIGLLLAVSGIASDQTVLTTIGLSLGAGGPSVVAIVARSITAVSERVRAAEGIGV
jgi:hypothetical protein